MAKKFNKNITIERLVKLIASNIENYKPQGNSVNNVLSGVATLKTANLSDISFYHNSNYKKDLANTHAGVVILAEKDAKFCKGPAIVHDNPHLAFAKILEFFSSDNNDKKPEIHKSVVIGDNCKISNNVYIGPNVVIGDNVFIDAETRILANSCVADNVIIGAGCKINSNVTICVETKIGNNCVLNSGCRIGIDGFGFAQSPNGWHKVPQIGKVILGNNVDIGANTTIDCGSLEDTIIGNGVKVDNQVQIGHNCVIGDNTIIAGCTGIAGSTIIGKNCMIGGGCNINGHIEIGDGVILIGVASVRKSVSSPGIYSSFLELCSFRDNLKLNANLKKFYEKV